MKQKLLLISLIIVGVCLGFSQEKGKVGFLFKSGSMNSVGLSFNLSDRWTLRPSLGFSTGKVDIDAVTTTPGTLTQKTRTYSADLGLFYHFLKKNSLSVYSGLEAGYSYRKWEKDIYVLDHYGLLWDKIEGFTGDAVLGLQYNFNKHLAVFGEVAVSFSKEKEVNKSDALYGADVTYKSGNWGLDRTGFGIILYL